MEIIKILHRLSFSKMPKDDRQLLIYLIRRILRLALNDGLILFRQIKIVG